MKNEMKNTKRTFTLTNLTDEFYEKLDSIQSNMEKFAYLLSLSKDFDRHIKYSLDKGNIGMRNRLEWNALFKKYVAEKLEPYYKIEPRRGYKLVTFYF